MVELFLITNKYVLVFIARFDIKIYPTKIHIKVVQARLSMKISKLYTSIIYIGLGIMDKYEE